MAMLRHRAAAHGGNVPARLLYSSRTWDDVIYRDEIARISDADPALRVAHTLTRGTPAGWSGYARRIDRAMLGEFTWSPADRPHIFVCGPTPMVEVVANALVELGHEPATIKTERFGPTG
jgi:ferredoxin-NADP reductase